MATVDIREVRKAFGSFEVPKIFVPEEHWRDFRKRTWFRGLDGLPQWSGRP